ncbi:uncharacterized protein YALI1_D02710g [Yarrowia lipolytica]|uniref:Uncharacterized protein n=1 Tax=Yarrowia lipolytica TaxID=4952 RepID=A0A1D8NCW1_YARLL|nr:hypothetical protein YALI1_D02710g [Yarrowia lipolytica]
MIMIRKNNAVGLSIASKTPGHLSGRFIVHHNSLDPLFTYCKVRSTRPIREILSGGVHDPSACGSTFRLHWLLMSIKLRAPSERHLSDILELL